MNFFLSFPIEPLPVKIAYAGKIMMVGSCFSAEIGERLTALKFKVLQNPTGIIYHPLVIAEVIGRCIDQSKFTEADLFENKGIWNSWMHHSSFSGFDPEEALLHMNGQLEQSHDFLKNGDFLFLTPATAYGYFLKTTNRIVANCHKMPGSIFEKKLSDAEEIYTGLSNTIQRIKAFNPELTMVFTISPVRHYRDGIIENTISKAQVVSAVHKAVGKFDNVFYFPSYEIMNDELRDYRFYKNDFAHPNETAVSYIFERFIDFAFEEKAKVLMRKVREITDAALHRPKFPHSKESNAFAKQQLENIHQLIQENPFLDFDNEIKHFQSI